MNSLRAFLILYATISTALVLGYLQTVPPTWISLTLQGCLVVGWAATSVAVWKLRQ